MADGSPEDRAVSKQINDTTFSASETGLCDSKKYDETNFDAETVKLSFYNEQHTSESCKKSDANSVVGPDRSSTTVPQCSINSSGKSEDGDDRKKRCLDRYDSSESSDSGVAVLSPTESSGSDITEPGSPQSPEPSYPSGEESASARMPPWASEPAPPPGARRIAVQPAPVRRANPSPSHRRITEFFNHKMKPQNGLKRDSSMVNLDDTKRKCLSKNGVTNELEKYISYLSQTLSPKVLMDVKKDSDTFSQKNNHLSTSKGVDAVNPSDNHKLTSAQNFNDALNHRPTDNTEKVHTTMNGFVDVFNGYQHSISKEKLTNGYLNGLVENKKPGFEMNPSSDPSAKSKINVNQHIAGASKCNKVAIPASSETGSRIAPSLIKTPSKKGIAKSDGAKMNGLVSSTTKLDSRMNGVTCGSNNLSLNPMTSKQTTKKEPVKKTTMTAKRTNRKSSACIANSKNLTWSKANNLKQQVQLQKQNCINPTQSSQMLNGPGEASAAPNINMANGVRQVPMTANGNLANLGMNMSNLQNCHQINLQQPCNGTVPHNNLTSFVAVPQNVMLTTLRIPSNGMPTQSINQQNNMTTFNRPNINVSGQTKLNGQIVFPYNLNGAVVQIPNSNHIMAKMPNFVLPQTAQIPAQTAQIQTQRTPNLFNYTLLKLANTDFISDLKNSTYSNVNKPIPPTSQSDIAIMMNKNVTGMQAVGMTVPSNPNYTVNLSHSVLMPQPGYIVTSVPNINVKETWSCTGTNTAAASQTSCSNPIVHHPTPIVSNFTGQTLHTSSIPIAPVKPPDNPIQGTDPPSSTVKESEISEILTKCDIPWLSKTVNNNIFTFDSSKMSTRPFAQVSSLSEKFESFKYDYGNTPELKVINEKMDISFTKDATGEELRKIEEVARREDTIFTQITVLKDVSSNVQSSVIESFSSATTESSESGIGTDKSIDSPSDSQTSKECDEDSTLSLSVSVSSVEVQSQKSPILKQPKILRFPPRNPKACSSDKRTSSTDTTSTVTVCMWENCKQELESDSDLLEHLQSVHVLSQAGKENFVCLWERCKVRGKPSCSRLWLERHAMTHGGNKPYKCIVDSCDKRFSTQVLLERHVNNHFNSIGQSPNTSGGKKTSDSAAKLMRRNGKKLRYRRQPWSARMFDFFDASTMEGLSWRLMRSTRWRLGGACPLREPEGKHTLTLHAALTATRYNVVKARREALVTYYPPHVVEDEWVPEKEVKRVKRVEMCELSAHTKVLLFEQFSASYKKSASPPPPPAPAAPRAPPPRPCASSRLLNNLLTKKKPDTTDCPSTNIPMLYSEVGKPAEVTGAKKRKMGRKYGGNAFWPCGR